MNAPRPLSAGQRSTTAFTLVELLVSMAVFLIIVTVFLVATQGVQKIWSGGDRQVETYQSGRAVLEIFSREITNAVVSDHHQFVVNPKLSAVAIADASTTPKTAAQAKNSYSLFCVAPNGPDSQANGSLCEIGYFLTRTDPDLATGRLGTYELKRFCLTPDKTAYYRASHAVALSTDAPWITAASAASPYVDMKPTFKMGTATSAVSTVSDAVIALWIRCFDAAGNPIPWLYAASGCTAASPLQFNSAAAFQMSSKEGSFDGDKKTFQYLPLPSATTLAAHRLPDSVEITMMLLDSGTLQRRATIPEMPAPVSAEGIPAQIAQFQSDLINQYKIRTAETFSARVHLANSSF